MAKFYFQTARNVVYLQKTLGHTAVACYSQRGRSVPRMFSVFKIGSYLHYSLFSLHGKVLNSDIVCSFRGKERL